MKHSWFAVVALVFTVSCGSDDPSPPAGTGGSGGGGSGGSGAGGSSTSCSDDPGPTGEYPCDVGPIIEAKCQRCHTTESEQDECYANKSCLKAPFSLLTWADTRAKYGGTPVYEHIPRVIENGSMPMKASDLSPPVQELTESEKTILIDWAEGCAPPAAAACD